jgi:hypothetical protein
MFRRLWPALCFGALLLAAAPLFANEIPRLQANAAKAGLTVRTVDPSMRVPGLTPATPAGDDDMPDRTIRGRGGVNNNSNTGASVESAADGSWKLPDLFAGWYQRWIRLFSVIHFGR